EIEVEDADGFTPLNCAARMGNYAAVKLLLGTGEADINRADKKGNTPLVWAAKEGHTGVVRLLFNTGKIDNVNAKNDEGETPLFSAVSSNSVETVKML
ncbi:ankyrin, partial [Periconia macrospinosa]